MRLIDTLTDPSGIRTRGVRVQAVSHGITKAAPLPKRWTLTSHERALRLWYDFSDMPGTSAVYAAPLNPEGWELRGQPTRIGCWARTPSAGHWLRATITDGEGTSKPLDLSPRRGIRPGEWTYVYADLPRALKRPLAVSQLYMVETETSRKHSGVLELRDLCAEYEERHEDWSGPVWENMLPEAEVACRQDHLDISARVMDHESGVDPGSIQVWLDGNRLSHRFDQETGRVLAKVAHLEEGIHEVVAAASDQAGNLSSPAAWSFRVDLSEDREPPELQVMMPLGGIQTRTLRPRIAVKIKDDHSGVDADTIRMKLNGHDVSCFYEHGVAWHMPATELQADSCYSVVLSVSDRASNRKEIGWSFRTGAAWDEPEAQASYEITVIGDGGYLNADLAVNDSDLQLQEQIRRIRREPSRLLLYTGDIVDYDSMDNYKMAAVRMEAFGLPYVMAIGNHEVAGTRSSVHYQQFFGETNYVLDYANLTIIGVDTSLGHISATDASQWIWLRHVLADAKGRHILMMMHVPPDERDDKGRDFCTGHGFLDAEESQRLYDLLAEVKRERAEGELIVLSGDFHVYLQKEIHGVKYITSGGGGKLTHIPPQDGGFYHYLQLRVTGDRMETRVIPLLRRLCMETTDLLEPLYPGDIVSMRATGEFVTHGLPAMSLPIGRPLHYSWKSSDRRVAEISPEGELHAREPGEVVITLACGGCSAYVSVRVRPR